MANTLEFIIKATDQASKVVKGIEDKITGSTGKMKKSLTDIESGFKLAGRAVQALSGVYDFLVADTVAYAKESKDLASTLQLTTQETQALIQVADDYGVSQGALTTALQMAVKNGYKPSIENLARLADETNQITDVNERADKMVKIFGRGWSTLVPLLDAGGDAMRAGASEAEAMGLILSDVAMNDMEAMRQEVDNMGDRLTGLKNKIASAVVPALLDIGESAMKVTDNISLTADEEGRLKNSVVLATVMFGENSIQVKAASQALLDYYNNLKRGRQIHQDIVKDIVAENNALMLNGDANVWAAAGIRSATQAQQTRSSGLVSAGQDLMDYIAQEEAGMKRASDEADRHAAALKAIELADIATAKAVAATTTAFLSQATSLQGATELSDFAKVALAGIEERMNSGELSASRYSAAYQVLGINAGIVTKESLAATRGIELINAQFDNLTAEEWSAAIAKVPEAAKDGVVTLKEVGIDTGNALRKTKQDLMDEMGNAAKDTVSGTSKAVSDSMIVVSNAVTATRSLVTNLKSDLKTLSDTQIMIKYSFVLVGSTPLSGGGLPTRDSGGSVGVGVPYMIGAGVRETFVPQQAGVVLPNNITTQITNNITTDRMGVALAMARAQQLAAEARM